jgi:hypothetical protein
MNLGSFKEGFQGHGRILSPHVTIGSASGSSTVEILENKLVTLRDSAAGVATGYGLENQGV